MTTYAITGGHGFLGWHLRCRLKAARPLAEVRVLGRGDLDDPDRLADAIDGCDAVFHLAAVNSHDAEAAANVVLAEQLVDALAKLQVPPHVVYSNSSHVERDSPYGRAKADAAQALTAWATRSGATFADVVLPNLFGEGGRPRYNSAVATFCEAVITGTPSEVNPDGAAELLHAQAAAAVLVRHADARRTGGERVRGEDVAVTDIYDRLARLYDDYRATHSVPPLWTMLDLRLFNQLRVAMFPAAYPVALVRHADARGQFFEAVRGSGPNQTSFSATGPGMTRGEHWHFDKVERFLVLHGSADIEIRRLFDDEVHTFRVSGERPAFVDMPTLYAHNITNTGDAELLTMFWVNDPFDPASPDTYPELVRPREAVPA
ncbi:MAG: NAD-dependent epimerase/dehydratase family protein [Acidimicrobiales bacterium]